MAYTPRHRRTENKSTPIAALKSLAAAYRSLTDLSGLKPSISLGNVKTGFIPSISLPPLYTCPNSAECRKSCYVMTNMLRGPHAGTIAKAYVKNWLLFQADADKYFSDVISQLAKVFSKGINTKAKKRLASRNTNPADIYTPDLVRWNVSGDLPNQRYLEGAKAVAKAFPGVRFLIFTKNYDTASRTGLDFSDLPANLEVVFSCWPGQDLPTDTKIPRAWLTTDDRAGDEPRTDCLMNCQTCRKCWALSANKQAIEFEVH